jgi:diguanylate cyclase (GGDEF)-like protein
LFLDRLTQGIDLSVKHGHPLAVLFIDLDGFKAINDGRGHAAGDGVLKEVARRIERGIDSGDSAARLGGDEFVVMLENCDLDRAAAIADGITKSIRAPLRFGRRRFYVGATVGVAMVDDQPVDADELLRRADIAMYRGKREGRNRVVISEHGAEAEHCWMIGNSPKSDITSAIEAGLGAVYIPHTITWSLEHEELPEPGERFRVAERFSDLTGIF